MKALRITTTTAAGAVIVAVLSASGIELVIQSRSQR